MTVSPDPNSPSALKILLQEERSALIAGNLAVLNTLSLEKERLLGLLNKRPEIAQNDLDQVYADLTRNQVLLKSAMEGVRSIADRLATLQRMRSSMGTYDSQGIKSAKISGTSGAVEKRS